MLIDYKLGQTSVILRVKIRDSSASTGAGLTGLTNASSGLIISTIADNEATATAYTVAGSTVETISTLGTFAAPTATKCRFKEVDATNHKGVYEIQIADARFAVSGAKSLLVSISGATNAAQCDVVVPLRTVDLYVSGGNLPANVSQVDGSTPAATALSRGLLGVAVGTVGSSSTTTSIVTSSLTPAAAVTDQFKGRIVTFDRNTTTTNLRGQSTDITGSSSGGVLTVTALTTAPVSGDTFTIS